MFKRFFVGFLAFAMISVQANAATNNNLKSAFDQLTYSLSVEWDQKDKAFYDAKMKDFTAQVAQLQAQGLTNAELVSFALAQVKDQKLAAELNAAFTMIQLNTINAADARKLVMETLSKSRGAQGASWAGDVLLIGGIVVLALVVALAAAGNGRISGGVGVGSGCYEDYVCYDYYDSWGYFWYSDCYYETYCY